MTGLQRAFISEYIKDGNGLRAAKRAGYSKRSAKFRASQLLAQSHIAAAVAAARARVLAASQVTMESHLAELARIRDLAIKAGQFSAAASAEANRGKVAGLYVERWARVDDLRALPDADLEAIAAGQAPN